MSDRDAVDTTARHPLVVSFRTIRRAVGTVGLVLPLLGPVGWLVWGIPLQDNLSSYYHTPLRDVFVGLMCSLGLFFFCYRGHDRFEDWTANLACVFALGLAFFPVDPQPLRLMGDHTWTGIVHGLAGAGFFLTMALYSLLHLPKSRHAIGHDGLPNGGASLPIDREGEEVPEPHRFERHLLYRLSGVSILVAMLAMGVYFALPGGWKETADLYNALYVLESIAIWSYAGAWLLKGRFIVADLAVEVIAVAEQRVAKRLGLPEWKR